MFGEMLKKLRKERKMTQSQLAELFGYSHVAVVKWENGTREPDFNTLIKLSDYFGVSIDYMITGKNKESEEKTDKDKYLKEIIKIFNAIGTEDRAYCLGFIVGVLQKRGIDVQAILENKE